MSVIRPDTVPSGIPTSRAALCFHCGEPCLDRKVERDDKLFCCTGCLTVYDILKENGLTGYYALEEGSGVNMRDHRHPEYAWLDAADVRDRLVDFRQGDQVHLRFHLPQIHCASCIWLLERLFSIHPSILKSQVSFYKKELQIVYDESKISLREVVELLARLGYAPSLNLADLDKPSRKAVDRRLLYQLGVAGFAFGNIMLLSFPEYLGLDAGSETRFVRLFGYLNLLLSLPVLLYSARDYFRSAIQGLRHRVLTIDMPIAIGVTALFGRSAYEILSGSGAGYLDSMAGLVFFLLIGRWFQQRTFHHLSFDRDYKSYFPVSARLLENGRPRSISLDLLEPGQVILVKHQELIPADGKLLAGEGIIDYSFVTGEAEPVHVVKGDRIFAGGRQAGGAIEVQLVRKVSNSYLTQLWNDAAFTKQESSYNQDLADRTGKVFTAGILLIATATLLFWLPRDVSTAVNAFTSVLIIACPCAVALAIPFVFGNAIRILGKQGFYLKNTRVIESLTRFTATVLDKTGTLTQSEASGVSWKGEALGEADLRLLEALTRPSSHPVSAGIHAFAQGQLQEGGDHAPVELVDWRESPGQGIQAFWDDQPVRLGSDRFVGGGMADDTGVAVFRKGDCITGHFQMARPLRQGLTSVLEFLRGKGPLWLLSGDNERERELFLPFFSSKDRMRFRQSPADKLRFIKQVQEQGNEVLMIGDGLNDAGALKQSDLGIVIAEADNNFTPACDAVLRADRFIDLPRFVNYARASVRVVYLAYGLALIYNIIGLSFAVQGMLSPLVAAILMPASSVSIVLFGVGLSTLISKRMGLNREAGLIKNDSK